MHTEQQELCVIVWLMPVSQTHKNSWIHQSTTNHSQNSLPSPCYLCGTALARLLPHSCFCYLFLLQLSRLSSFLCLAAQIQVGFLLLLFFLKVTTWCPSVTLEPFEVTSPCFCFWLIFLWHHSCLNCLWGRLAYEKPCSFPINGFPITNTHHHLSTIFVIMKAGGKSHKQTREQKGLK